MLNSLVTAEVVHTKIQKPAHTLDVKATLGGLSLESFWSGIETDIILQLLDKDGRSIYYFDINNIGELTIPTLIKKTTLSGDWEYDISELEQVTIINEDCEEEEVGCLKATLSLNLSKGAVLNGWDECYNKFDIPNHNVKILPFVYSNTAITASSEDKYFHALEDPFAIKMNNQEETYLEHIKTFDVEDIYGVGKVVGSDDTEISIMMKTIFDDQFTADLNEKILNFTRNIIDTDLSDIGSLEDLGEMIGVKRDGFIGNIPKELLDVIKLASMKYEDIFGVVDQSKVYSSANIGAELDGSVILNVGDIIFAKPKYDNLTPLEPLVVATQVTGGGNTLPVTGLSSYPLSSLKTDTVSYDTHDFWGNNGLTGGDRKGTTIELHLLPYIPTREQWIKLLTHRIEYLLTLNTVYGR